MKRILLVCTLFAVVFAFAADLNERAAFRNAVNENPSAETIRRGLANQDEGIRRYALARLYLLDSSAGLEAAGEALGDISPEVRKLAVTILGHHPTPERLALLKKCADYDLDSSVRGAAKNARWPFHRNNVLLKDDPAWDYQVNMVKQDTISQSEWRAAVDAEGNGHTEGWCNETYNDSTWTKVVPGKGSLLKKPGIVWYRTVFTAEAPAKFNSFEIVIPKVSGTCCVWLNGVYLGQRTVGGNPQEVRFNGGAEVQPGKINHLAIRIDGPAKGGILSNVFAEWME